MLSSGGRPAVPGWWNGAGGGPGGPGSAALVVRHRHAGGRSGGVAGMVSGAVGDGIGPPRADARAIGAQIDRAVVAAERGPGVVRPAAPAAAGVEGGDADPG